MNFCQGSEIEDFRVAAPGRIPGIWGLGITPTSGRRAAVYTDALLANMHPVITDALLATFASGKTHPVITDALLATFITHL